MRFPTPLLLVLLVVPLAAAEPENPEDADLETPTKAPPWGPGDASSEPATVRFGSWLLYGAWAALAGVVGLVVVSSLAKTRPVPGDPLVTAPGVPVGPASRATVPYVPVPHRAAFEAGRDLAFRAGPESIEQAVRLVAALGLGEAVVLRDPSGARLVRIADCSSCRARGRERKRWKRETPQDACGFEEGFLAAAFECALRRDVRVVERKCGAGRDACCDFLVV